MKNEEREEKKLSQAAIAANFMSRDAKIAELPFVILHYSQEVFE